MFFNDKKNDRVKMLHQLTFSSKAALKQQCLFFSNGSIKEAKELYEFLIEDMPDLPATDPIPLSWQDNTRDTVNGILGWVKDNKDTIVQSVDLIRGFFVKLPSSPGVAEPLEPINNL